MANDIRKEVRLSAEDTISLMRAADELGISESDVMRMGLRLLVKKFTKTGLLELQTDSRNNAG